MSLMNKLPLSVVKESLCVPVDGSAWGLPFFEVWINHDGDFIYPARLDFVGEGDQRVLSDTAVLRRRPTGNDYGLVMVKYFNKLITKDECSAQMKKMREENLIIETSPYPRIFRGDRQI